MTPERAAVLAYLETRAARLRERADKGAPGWGMARRGARVLRVLASDIAAGLHEREEADG